MKKKHTLIASALLLVLAGCAAVAPKARQHFDLEAHRGGRGLAPENTLAAFSNAVDMGVTTLELDIGLTADGVVVISHDTSLNPDHTRDASGAWLAPKSGAPIRTLTLAQLQTYDVGRINPASNYGKLFALQIPRDGERIPTLASLFAQVQARGADAATVRFNIETKIDPSKPDETAAPEPMVRALLAEIDKANMAGRVTIQSFDWRTLTLVGKLAPQMPRAYLSTARTLKDKRWTDGFDAASFASVPQMVRAASANAPGPVIWSPAFADLTPEVIREAQKLDLKVLPWTVNQRADMQRLMDWGADGIITDYPDILRDLMRERGLSLPPPGKNAS
ncbi:glycerophosphodiester phosphodiesterase family protein [Variovorax sp. W6]|uniref:glycerophosphodiester phosphodiesterase n=1 Tax=Variovorax sp. W6 TaxID=3093895 RepID=UPI003D806CB3